MFRHSAQVHQLASKFAGGMIEKWPNVFQAFLSVSDSSSSLQLPFLDQYQCNILPSDSSVTPAEAELAFFTLLPISGTLLILFIAFLTKLWKNVFQQHCEVSDLANQCIVAFTVVQFLLISSVAKVMNIFAFAQAQFKHTNMRLLFDRVVLVCSLVSILTLIWRSWRLMSRAAVVMITTTLGGCLLALSHL